MKQKKATKLDKLEVTAKLIGSVASLIGAIAALIIALKR